MESYPEKQKKENEYNIKYNKQIRKYIDYRPFYITTPPLPYSLSDHFKVRRQPALTLLLIGEQGVIYTYQKLPSFLIKSIFLELQST